ncbi:MAG: SHOCT domain-containing protein [Candidatus Parvarchaeota archaeon]
MKRNYLRLKRLFTLFVTVAVLGSSFIFSSGGASSSPQIFNSTVVDQQNVLTMPSGNQAYIYGASGGGASSMSPFGFANDSYAAASDPAASVACQIAMTSSNTNSYSSTLMYYAIGGVGVSGFSSYKAIYGYNNTSGASGVSAKFNIYNPALIVIIALSSSQNLISIGGISGFIIDATDNNSSYSSEAIMIGHAYLNSGSYDVFEQSANNVYAIPQHRADLIGIIAFFGSRSTSVTRNLAVFIWSVIAILVIAIGAGTLIVLRKRGGKQKNVKSESKEHDDKSIQRLAKLKELYDKGLISEKEYEDQKRKLHQER